MGLGETLSYVALTTKARAKPIDFVRAAYLVTIALQSRSGDIGQGQGFLGSRLGGLEYERVPRGDGFDFSEISHGF